MDKDLTKVEDTGMEWEESFHKMAKLSKYRPDMTKCLLFGLKNSECVNTDISELRNCQAPRKICIKSKVEIIL
jgi:hypothetical protein